MQPIPLNSITAFLGVLAAVSLLALHTARWLAPYCSILGDYRGIVVAGATLIALYLYAIVTHRLLLLLVPLREGKIAGGDSREFHYHIYTLFYLIFFNSLIRSRLVPIPLMRLVYIALGARLGINTYSAGIIFDPSLVVIGANTLVGESAMLVPHVIEGCGIEHYRIAIGNNVTIGAGSVIMAAVSIGDGVVIAANSVVSKGCRIPAGQVWGGTPARRIGERSLPAFPPAEII